MLLPSDYVLQMNVLVFHSDKQAYLWSCPVSCNGRIGINLLASCKPSVMSWQHLVEVCSHGMKGTDYERHYRKFSGDTELFGALMLQ